MSRPLSATDILSPLPALKVGMISLGCAKNLVDAEIMLGDILAHGMEVTATAEDADVVIVNTCAFIDSAKEESIEAILDAHQERGLRKRSGQKLVVSGCMSQRFASELASEIPEVDAFMGLDQIAQAGEIVRKVVGRPEAAGRADPGAVLVESDAHHLSLGRFHRRPADLLRPALPRAFPIGGAAGRQSLLRHRLLAGHARAPLGNAAASPRHRKSGLRHRRQPLRQ